MLKQLISRFFEQQDPNAVIQQRLNELWADWLLPIMPDKPTGEDLTYHDTFQEVKEEIAKLSGIDYELVSHICEQLIKEESKDIRLASYYCLARLQLDGAEGFADGLELLAGLLDKFGDLLYPSRNHIRKNAIEWLGNAKFIDLLYKLQPIPEAILVRIVAALNLIEISNQKCFSCSEASGDSLPDLQGLIRFFVHSIERPVKVHKTPSPSETLATAESAEPTSVAEQIKIRSQRDLLDQARKMAQFLREKPEGFLAAGRFLRALRWDTINHLPPCDQRNCTRLPAPRNELRQNLSRLLIQQQWHELFERVETAFMEGANHFWLDLHRYAVLALQKMGLPYSQWADIYLTDLGLMLERLPGIDKLYFENAMPFADDETLSWIESHAKIHRLGEENVLAPIAVNQDDIDWYEIEQQGIELANKDNLETAFKWLQDLPNIHSTQQQFLLRYTQARIAEAIGRKETAQRLLQLLNQQQNQIALMQWEPDLLFDIKAHLFKLLQSKYQAKDSNKPQLLLQLDALQQELLELNPTRAVMLNKQ